MRLISAQQYHDIILASQPDRDIRAMFQRAVLGLARPVSSILDFGSGTGIDIKAYAGRGHTLYSYDASRAMRDFLSESCRHEVDSGEVTMIDCTYDEFLRIGRLREGGVDLISANFAVVNAIADHRSLFEAFDRWLSPDGCILLSVLSPYYVGDLRYGWWWRNVTTLLRSGRYSVEGREGVSHRFRLSTVRAAAAPYFILDRILPSAATGAVSSFPFLAPCTCRFRFLSFRRPRPQQR